MPAFAAAGTKPKPRPLTPVTADSSLFSFYDIESLSNVFSVVAYTPRPGEVGDELEVFYLVDDAALARSLDPQALVSAIRAGNPGLPTVDVLLHDLHTIEGNLRLAQLIGLSDADQVCDPDQESSYPLDLRPVCDTDPEFDPAKHPFLAGYNSLNYDTTMLALYLAEVFSDIVGHRQRLADAQRVLRFARTPEQIDDAEGLLNQVLSRRPVFQPVTARSMRAHSDQLFDEKNIDYMPRYIGWESPAAKIRRAMIHSGRHLDISRLNEIQSKVALKRLLGMLGRQIKESGKLGHDAVITTVEELYELLAYNVADCLGLAQLFRHPTYSSAFDLKAGLLAQYSETVFTRKQTVRRDRLSIDSSSAKFVGRILAPYTALSDIPTVSFSYPHPEVAKERGIRPVNVLDECVRFFEEEVAPDRATNAAQAKAYAEFMQVVAYYRSIEGQNFNSSEEYAERYSLPAKVLDEIPKTPNNLPYFLKDGTPSSCFATFSTGGIHGAEVDLESFERDSAAHRSSRAMLEMAKLFYPEAKDFVAEAKRQHNLLTLPDGTYVDKRLVLLGSDPEKVKYRKARKDDPEQVEQLARAQAQVPDAADLLKTQRPEAQALDVAIADSKSPGGVRIISGRLVLSKSAAASAEYRTEPAKPAPELFPAKKADGSTKLHPKYTRTSAGLVTHEDFTSYYPNLLRNMRAFWNPELGEDRYATIFFDKERYGQEMKQPGIPVEQKTRLNTLRNGTKLILNAASGAGDASHKTPIRMNNVIISMRIIGQLFSWRIGQAQTLAGARIISTNTDGLYSILDPEINNRVLAEQAELIGVDIEPEPMFLISKDSNNRLELLPPRGASEDLPVAQWEIHSAGGGTLACHAGPRPDKSLAHPAVIDHALARYLQAVTAARGENALAEPYDAALGRKLLDETRDPENPVRTALMFQTMITASRGSITYPFAADPMPASDGESDNEAATITNPRPLQMVNRAFVVRAGTQDAVSLHNAGAWKVTPAVQAKRRGNAESPARGEIAKSILAHHGWASDSWTYAQNQKMRLIPEDQDVTTRRINGIDPSWSMVICNEDLHSMEASRLARLISSLDLDVYTQMLGETFTKNWMNAA
ncbi:hypothetical protein [Arthrobacter bambusae]|uniref:DNA-directed DNA polymerase n=1 Tax=Arthrobacter bambusae TaxID=1338426 RepID=A0AAW8DAH3_9MICC|nr:hypothetical protein [Arthrobacter bambusae]MDP9904730.1 hypothetical protein [Arthrobacter bambusae]MDQ0129546.1 hypothetical protein [Arthrobacter bambusae]MDQ0180841.1 hypothetical protein [Arthrobacter bambusae]